MRKFTIPIILLFFLFSLSFNFVSAQCPGCLVNVGCTVTPAKPTVCPDTLPNGTAMQPYSEDISFYLPAEFVDDGTGFTVTLNQLTVLSVSGLPYGLSWETNAASNIYYPSSNPPATEHGCAKMCGTPIMAGIYMVTVFVRADVTVAGIGQTVDDNFDIPLTILPGSTSNGSFTIQNPLGCAPLTSGFTNLIPSGGNPAYSYHWDFGNGNLSNLENPPDQNYSNPGTYIVSMQTTIDTIGYFLSSVSVLAATSGCDDSPFSSPDYYFILMQGASTIYTSSYIDNTDAPVTFAFSPIQMSNATYTIQVWDYDTGMAGGDDHCNSDVTFNGFSAGTQMLSSGNLIVSITIDHPMINQTATDTIKVFPIPVVGSVVISPNDSVCNGDSVLLRLTSGGGEMYQWFRDTSAIFNAIDTFYYAKQSGVYYCEVTNSSGCRSYSTSQSITIMSNPPKPTFWIVGNILNTNSSAYLQWYFEGNAIPGATGMTCAVTATGNYFLVASNHFGCTSVSDTVFVTYNNSGIADNTDAIAFRLFPNPAHNKFTVEMDIIEASDVILKVSDILGKILLENNYGQQIGFIRREVDISGISAGMYLITIEASGKKVFQRLSIY
jgi:hypothetical protein